MTDIADSNANYPNSFVPIGKITSAHSIKGEVKIHIYNNTSSFEDNECFFDDRTAANIKIKSIKGNIIIATIADIDSRTKAERLKNKEIFINLTETISANEFYYQSLIGMDVKSTDLETLGTISNVDNYGASDIIEVTFTNNSTELFNFTDENFPKIHIEKNYVILTPPEII
ncbi:MAG: 16S rRNA processing protein RimM [Rickettsiales bacterium]|mgnify:CR=1 FL=1|jgi:16S rRNA processing protein RimM|nr:16S rRNA processing protein RimM [Rickettsiales bacterium]